MTEIGFEGSGIVRAVGTNVGYLTAGDRVMFLGSGCFTTLYTLNASLCVKMDDLMTFEKGAVLPCVYATALMALADKLNLRKGQVCVRNR